jgi:ABC-type uncharacterized transport system fused permease/ATPase subunit
LYTHTLIYYLTNALNLAFRNSLLEAIATVYRDAQRELRLLATRAGPGPITKEIKRHDTLISSFLEVSHYRARFFGFVVTFGTLTTLVVTVITIGVALWSVLRGIGLVSTLESFCSV